MTFVMFSCVAGKHAASYIRERRWGRRAVAAATASSFGGKLNEQRGRKAELGKN